MCIRDSSCLFYLVYYALYYVKVNISAVELRIIKNFLDVVYCIVHLHLQLLVCLSMMESSDHIFPEILLLRQVFTIDGALIHIQMCIRDRDSTDRDTPPSGHPGCQSEYPLQKP